MRKLTTDEFIARARLVHGNRYDYSHVMYRDAKTTVCILCRKHGEFEQLPHNHLRGAGCAICNKVEKRRMDPGEFVRRASEIHHGKYDYSDVVYVNNRTCVVILCPKHGAFSQTPYKHLSGQGCPICAPNHKDTKESFVEKAKQVHGDLYDYSKVIYMGESVKVCIVDPLYGEFWQTPNAHLNGRGCPMRKGKRIWETRAANGFMSRVEKTVFDRLVEKFGIDDVEREYKSEEYPFSCDLHVRSLNLYIELHAHPSHGGHWFDSKSPEDAQKLKILLSKSTQQWSKHYAQTWASRDIVKRNVAIQNSLNYLVFWKSDLSDFMEWYDNFDTNPVLKNV